MESSELKRTYDFLFEDKSQIDELEHFLSSKNIFYKQVVILKLTCNKCGETKVAEKNFFKDARKKYGYEKTCKECRVK